MKRYFSTTREKTIKRMLVSSIMKVSICSIALLLVRSESLCAQSAYNLDSVQLVSFFAPSFSNIKAEKYTYDDQDRLLTKSAGSQYSTFHYDESLVTEIVFSRIPDLDPFETGRNTQELNDDDFILKHRYEIINGPNSTLTNRLDSIVRDKNNRAIEEYTFLYDWTRNRLSLGSSVKREFDKNGNNTLLNIEFYSLESAVILFSDKFEYQYNDKNQVIKETQTSLNGQQSGMVSISEFEYSLGRITSVDRTVTFDNSNPQLTRREYEYDLPYSTINNYVIWEGQKGLFQSSYQKHSQSRFFELDSLVEYTSPSTENKLTAEMTNREIANDSRDSIFIHEFRKGFDFNSGAVNFFSSRKMFYSKKNNPPINVLLSDIYVHPNPSGPNGQLFVNTRAEDYDRYVIVNSLGQVVKREPINYSFEAVINSTINSSGLYFIRFQLGEIPVTEWARIVIQ